MWLTSGCLRAFAGHNKLTVPQNRNLPRLEFRRVLSLDQIRDLNVLEVVSAIDFGGSSSVGEPLEPRGHFALAFCRLILPRPVFSRRYGRWATAASRRNVNVTISKTSTQGVKLRVTREMVLLVVPGLPRPDSVSPAHHEIIRRIIVGKVISDSFGHGATAGT